MFLIPEFSFQMEDGYRLIDYGININDVVQLMVRATPVPTVASENNEDSQTDAAQEKEIKGTKKTEDESLMDVTCEFYEVRFYDMVNS